MSDNQNSSPSSAPDDAADRLSDVSGLILTYGIRERGSYGNPEFAAAVKRFHDSVGVPAAHNAYFEAARVLAERRRELQYARRSDDEAREIFLCNIPGESEHIICATSGYTDKAELIRRIESGEVRYPYRDNLPLSREKFIHWMRVLSLFDRWDLGFYALEESIGNSVYQGRPLTGDDIAFVADHATQLIAAIRHFEGEDLTFLDAATVGKIHKNYQFFMRAYSELHAEFTSGAPDAARLIVALEKMAIAIAGISSKIGFYVCGRTMSDYGNCVDRADDESR